MDEREMAETIRSNFHTDRTIKPIKLAAMMKKAGQITDSLLKVPGFLMSYGDILFILEIITDAVRKAEQTERGVRECPEILIRNP